MTICQRDPALRPESLPSCPMLHERFRSAVRGWPLEHRAVYLEALFFIWDYGYVPSDPVVAQRVLGVFPETASFEEIWSLVCAKFVPAGDGDDDGGRLTHSVMEEEYRKALKGKSRKRAQTAKARATLEAKRDGGAVDEMIESAKQESATESCNRDQLQGVVTACSPSPSPSPSLTPTPSSEDDARADARDGGEGGFRGHPEDADPTPELESDDVEVVIPCRSGCFGLTAEDLAELRRVHSGVDVDAELDRLVVKLHASADRRPKKENAASWLATCLSAAENRPEKVEVR